MRMSRHVCDNKENLVQNSLWNDTVRVNSPKRLRNLRGETEKTYTIFMNDYDRLEPQHDIFLKVQLHDTIKEQASIEAVCYPQ